MATERMPAKRGVPESGANHRVVVYPESTLQGLGHDPEANLQNKGYVKVESGDVRCRVYEKPVEEHLKDLKEVTDKARSYIRTDADSAKQSGNVGERMASSLDEIDVPCE